MLVRFMKSGCGQQGWGKSHRESILHELDMVARGEQVSCKDLNQYSYSKLGNYAFVVDDTQARVVRKWNVLGGKPFTTFLVVPGERGM
jgi:hypothetical protein